MSKAEFLKFWNHYFPILIVGGFVVAACASHKALPRNFRPVAVVVVVISAFEVVTSSGDNYPYERYLVVILPVILAMAVAAICQVCWPSPERAFQDVAPSTRTLIHWVSSCIAILLAMSLIAAFTSQEVQATTGSDLNVSRGVSHLHSLFSADTLSKHSGRYHFLLAALLNRTQPPGSGIAMDEVGTLAYYTHMHVIDLYGLADTRISHLPGAPGDRANPNYVFSHHPRDIVLLFTGCLCSALPEDTAYAQDPRMLQYQLTKIFYTSVPGALLYESDASAATFASLDPVIPIDVRRVLGLPMTLQHSLAVQELDSISHGGNPSPELRAGALLAIRPRFTIIAPGATASIPLVSARERTCTVNLTALSPGSPVPQQLSAVVNGTESHELAATTLELGTPPSIQTSRLTFSVRDLEPLTLTVSGTSDAEWAEPFMTCQSA